ncbi:Hypothetical predicted protein [Mytilus galloprovincialis]|uniref:Uncharacterized protein n=2 Tax=Mytilus galloprovincialis TaxID=29158 RepID=A0A8B6FNR1_MYTGA|nr:Hypothetical predicted protein [Mytilus galloprovincialis]
MIWNMSRIRLVVFATCQVLCLVQSLNTLDGVFTGTFLDTIAKAMTKTGDTGCDKQTANQTNPYFFGVTDLKCLQIEAKMRTQGYDMQDIQDLREKYPNLIGKRSVREKNKTKSSEPQNHSPTRSTLRPVHRWIFYEGYFIEFGAGSGNIGNFQDVGNKTLYSALNGNSGETNSKFDENSLSNANMQTVYPKNGDLCSAKMESEIAGYSSVPLGCLYKCARSFVTKFGKYHLIKNNCHRFANKLSNILCTGICPEWCK